MANTFLVLTPQMVVSPRRAYCSLAKPRPFHRWVHVLCLRTRAYRHASFDEKFDTFENALLFEALHFRKDWPHRVQGDLRAGRVIEFS